MNSLGWTTVLLSCEPRPARWCILGTNGDFLPIKISLSGVLNTLPRHSFKPKGKTSKLQHPRFFPAFLFRCQGGI